MKFNFAAMSHRKSRSLRYFNNFIPLNVKRIFSLFFFNSLFFFSGLYAQTTNQPPTADAGPDQTICAGDPIILDGSFGGSATSGTFYLVEDQGILIKKGVCPPPSNCNFQLAPPPSILGETKPIIQTYIFVTDDLTGEFGPAVDTVIITINPAATADAGPNQTVCAGSPIVLNSSFGGGATSGTFKGGKGNFSGNIYTPTAEEVAAGFVNLIYTANDPDGSCPAATDEVIIKITQCAPYCTFGQGFYGSKNGKECMPKTTFTATELIAAAINNMPSQQLYLGRGNNYTDDGGSFTVNTAQAALLNDLLPVAVSKEFCKEIIIYLLQLTIRQLKIRNLEIFYWRKLSPLR